MKKIVSLMLLVMMLVACMPASAEVTVQDIQNAYVAAAYESVRISGKADLTMAIAAGGTTQSLPVSMDFRILQKDSRMLMEMGMNMQGMSLATLTYYVEGTRMTMVIDVMGQNMTESMDLPEPISMNGQLALPQDAVVTATADGYSVSISFADLMSNLGSELDSAGFSFSGDAECAYNFDSDLKPIGAFATFNDLSMNVPGTSVNMSGTMTFTFDGFNDISDDELVAPAAVSTSKAA